jgi:hypothetical protein
MNRVYDNDGKKFFMPMNYAREHRDKVYRKFFSILSDSIYSYAAKGIRLPNDVDRNSLFWDRHIDIDWYNQTHFSVVVETSMNNNFIFLTEKSMKPLMYKHPFMILGCNNSLAFLKSAGFQTFENLFDETYDSLSSGERIDAVYQQTVDYEKSPYDSITREKLEYNHRLFFNQDEVKRRYANDLMLPLLEKINA